MCTNTPNFYITINTDQLEGVYYAGPVVHNVFDPESGVSTQYTADFGAAVSEAAALYRAGRSVVLRDTDDPAWGLPGYDCYRYCYGLVTS